MVTFGDVHQQMSGKNSNWLSDIKQCIHYKEPDLDCTLVELRTMSIRINIRSPGQINTTILCVLNNFNFLWLI